MKNKIKLTEKDLHNIIQESVKRILKEGYSDYSEIYNKFQKIKEYLGPDELVDRMLYFMYVKDMVEGFERYLYSTGQMADFENQDEENEDDEIEGVDYPHITDWD